MDRRLTFHTYMMSMTGRHYFFNADTRKAAWSLSPALVHDGRQTSVEGERRVDSDSNSPDTPPFRRLSPSSIELRPRLDSPNARSMEGSSDTRRPHGHHRPLLPRGQGPRMTSHDYEGGWVERCRAFHRPTPSSLQLESGSDITKSLDSGSSGMSSTAGVSRPLRRSTHPLPRLPRALGGRMVTYDEETVAEIFGLAERTPAMHTGKCPHSFDFPSIAHQKQETSC